MKFNLKMLIPGGLTVAALIMAPAIAHLITGTAQAFPLQAVETLDLTPEQQSELDTLWANARSQVEALLTPEQQSTLQASLDADTPYYRAFRNLDLSVEQRQSLRDIMAASWEAGQNILTPEQQQELRQIRGNRHGSGRFAQGGSDPWSAFADLNLSTEQQSQIDAIRSNTRTQVEAVLTDEQQSTFQASVSEDNFRGVFRSLNLSDEQRTEIHNIMQASRDAVDNVLTDEQKQQLRDNMSTRWEHRGQ